jgi:DNA mismatch repair protein MutS
MQVDTKMTPMMVQWSEIKANHKDAILLFRLGDFYEGFQEDAILLSRELDLTLTKRGETPMAGIPYHSAEGYIETLVAKGYRVAIAEQTEEAKPGKGLVKREVVRVITPATHFNSKAQESNYFASICQTGTYYGLALIDISTSDFKTTEFDNFDELRREVLLTKPKEILVGRNFESKHSALFDELAKNYKPLISALDEWRFDHSVTLPALINHFKVHSLDGFGLKGMNASINCCGAMLTYLKDILNLYLEGILSVQPYSTKAFLSIDSITERNLELTESIHDLSRKNTLLELLDKTHTPMGSRLLRSWIKQPLMSLEKIQARQEAVESLMKDSLLTPYLKAIYDLERLTMKVAADVAGPKDLVALKHSLKPIPEIKLALKNYPGTLLEVLNENLKPQFELVELLENALVEEPPLRVSDGGLFKMGYNAQLDELKVMSHDSKNWMALYQANLKEETGIKNLKVGYTRVSGFYIEVSRGQSEKVPTHFQRRQTLTNAERYITADLKDYEEKVLTAEDKALRLETELFQKLRESIKPHYESIIRTAQAIAHIDSLLSLSEVAKKYNYIKPELDHSDRLIIKGGRHPIIEAKGATAFIPNDTDLEKDMRLMLITGPNMAGKSTYIRQVALIAIMAQIGSFVPAKNVQMGLIDKVFTRIGASDDLTRGQSTFMVEMTETANILNNATPRSLVILDEIGRGTSTYDGISIAWSVAEYLLTQEDKRAKTLFATHFWEMTKLEEKNLGAINFTIAVHESQGEITFLRKIIRGGTDKSYGIHVAKLAGLPSIVVERAHEILRHLEETSGRDRIFEPGRPKKAKATQQLNLF